MLKKWNEKVKKDETVYYLGDLAFLSRTKLQEFVYRMNGKIHLIRGNHDHYYHRSEIAGRFESVKDYCDLKIQDSDNPKKYQLIVLCHYPIENWNGKHYKSWHLHGHSHGKTESKNILRLDVGVDNFNFNPVTYEQIKEIMNKKII